MSSIRVLIDAVCSGKWSKLCKLLNYAGTSFPSSPSDGQSFWRTDLRRTWVWDEALNKWVGELEFEGYGDSGGLNNNQYFRRFNGMATAADQGVGYPYEIVIQEHGANWATPDNATGNIEIEINGSTVLHSLPTIGDGPSHDDVISVTVPANAIIAYRRDGGTINNTQGYIKYRRCLS